MSLCPSTCGDSHSQARWPRCGPPARAPPRPHRASPGLCSNPACHLQVIHVTGRLRARSLGLVALGHTLPPAPLAELPLHGHMIVFRLSLGLTILACESRYRGWGPRRADGATRESWGCGSQKPSWGAWGAVGGGTEEQLRAEVPEGGGWGGAGGEGGGAGGEGGRGVPEAPFAEPHLSPTHIVSLPLLSSTVSCATATQRGKGNRAVVPTLGVLCPFDPGLN